MLSLLGLKKLNDQIIFKGINKMFKQEDEIRRTSIIYDNDKRLQNILNKSDKFMECL